MMPFSEKPCLIPLPCGPRESLPRVGLKPTTPQQLAGIRAEPAPSVASAITAMPLATAAAPPPVEPPGDKDRSHGLRATPYTSLIVVGEDASSGLLVAPIIVHPAFSSLETAKLLVFAR